jgi:hypothetical protein
VRSVKPDEAFCASGIAPDAVKVLNFFIQSSVSSIEIYLVHLSVD